MEEESITQDPSLHNKGLSPAIPSKQDNYTPPDNNLEEESITQDPSLHNKGLAQIIQNNKQLLPL